MTEAEWLACTNPESMVERLHVFERVSNRKWRLFAVGRCRQVYRFSKDVPEAGHQLVEPGLVEIERYADKEGTYEKMRDAVGAMTAAWPRPPAHALLQCIMVAAGPSAYRAASMLVWPNRKSSQSYLLRDIVGNPFRPVAIDRAWLSPTVTQLVQAIYYERTFDRLPLLADALEEAGCTNADILSHCRQPGEHVRGCWVVDLLLAKQ